jgi:predicted deacylase
LEIGGERVRRGEIRDIPLKVSETSMGVPVSVPLRVERGAAAGPVVFVTGAVHGDELNGVGIIRELMFSRKLVLERGTLILVPVVNVFGFERHTRYLPDRRDLNRSFPGDPRGSLAFRLANVVFSEVVAKSHFGIDLHTATLGRTNAPHVRADLSLPGLEALARCFGCEVILDRRGDEKSLREVACQSGCKTINVEVGGALKIESGAVAIGKRGVLNVLRKLDMIAGRVQRPAYQTVVKKSVWVRAQTGGLLRFHAGLGDLVEAGQPLATCDAFFRDESPTLHAPFDGIVLGLTTLPVVRPGEPICHLGIPDQPVSQLTAALARAPNDLMRRVQLQLGQPVHVDARKKKRRAAGQKKGS